MRLLLALILTMSSAFALHDGEIVLEMKQKKVKAPKSVNSNAVNASINSGKNKLVHKRNSKHDVFKNKTTGVLNNIEGSQYNINVINNLREVDGAGNLIGPIDIFSAESSTPRNLKFRFTTNNEDFSVKEVWYQFFGPGEDVSEANNMQLADLQTIDGTQYLFVDILPLDPGDYQVVLRVHTQKEQNNGSLQDKHIRYARADFNRGYIDSAHAVIESTSIAPNGFLAEFTMKNSYSDFGGEIVSYSYAVYKGEELVSTDKVNVAEFGTDFSLRFKEVGTYKVHLTVKDSFLDTDTAISEDIVVTNAAPVLKYQLTQNQEYQDLVNLDFNESYTTDGSQILVYGLIIFQNGEEVERYFTTNKTFDYQINARGDFNLLAVIATTTGTNNIELDALNFIDPSVVQTLALSPITDYVDENDPRRYWFAFEANINPADVQGWQLKATNTTTGEVLMGDSEDVFFENNAFSIDYNMELPATYIFETRMVAKDGRVSPPFIKEVDLNFDLGNIFIDINILAFIPNNNKLVAVFPIGGSPGNYGDFSSLTCSYTNQTSGTQLNSVYNEQAMIVTFPERGLWDVECIAEHSLGGIEAKWTSVHEVTNFAPQVSFTYSETTPRSYNFQVNATDADDGIASVELVATKPDGSQIVEQQGFDFNYYLSMIGTWKIKFFATDNAGLTSESNEIDINIVNNNPNIDFEINLVDIYNREYEIYPMYSDYETFVSNVTFEITNPFGDVISLDSFESFNLDFNLIGKWTIKAIAIDSDGAVTEMQKDLVIINEKPIIEISQSLINEKERKYLFVLNVNDSDGIIESSEIIVENLDTQTRFYSEDAFGNFEYSLSDLGRWKIEINARDNDGDITQNITYIDIVNKSPITTFEFIETISNQYNFSFSATDLDGEIVEEKLLFNSPNGQQIEIDVNNKSNYETSFFEQGEWGVSYYVKDNEGKEEIKYIQLMVDSFDPTFEITSSLSEISQGDTVELEIKNTFSPSNNVEFDFEWEINGESKTGELNYYYVESLEDIVVEIKVKGSNNYENTIEKSFTVNPYSTPYRVFGKSEIVLMANSTLEEYYYITSFVENEKYSLKLETNIEGVKYFENLNLLKVENASNLTSEIKMGIYDKNNNYVDDYFIKLEKVEPNIISTIPVSANPINFHKINNENSFFNNTIISFSESVIISEVVTILEYKHNELVEFKIEGLNIKEGVEVKVKNLPEDFLYYYNKGSNLFAPIVDKSGYVKFFEIVSKIYLSQPKDTEFSFFTGSCYVFSILGADITKINPLDRKFDVLDFVKASPDKFKNVKVYYLVEREVQEKDDGTGVFIGDKFVKNNIINLSDSVYKNILNDQTVKPPSLISNLEFFEEIEFVFTSERIIKKLSANGDSRPEEVAGALVYKNFASSSLDDRIIINSKYFAESSPLEQFSILAHEKKHVEDKKDLSCRYYQANKDVLNSIGEIRASVFAIENELSSLRSYYTIDKTNELCQKNNMFDKEEDNVKYNFFENKCRFFEPQKNIENLNNITKTYGFWNDDYGLYSKSYLGDSFDLNGLFENLKLSSHEGVTIEEYVYNYDPENYPSSIISTYINLLYSDYRVSNQSNKLSKVYAATRNLLNNDDVFVPNKYNFTEAEKIKNDSIAGYGSVMYRINRENFNNLISDDHFLLNIKFNSKSTELINDISVYAVGISGENKKNLLIEGSENIRELNSSIKFSDFSIDSKDVVNIVIINHSGVEYEFSIDIITPLNNCNEDNSFGDKAYPNLEGGFVAEGINIPSNVAISDGARVCGNSFFKDSSNRIEISGPNVILEDVRVEDKCLNFKVLGAVEKGVEYSYISQTDFCNKHLFANSEINNDILILFDNENQSNNIIDSELNGGVFLNNPFFYNVDVYGSNFYSMNSSISNTRISGRVVINEYLITESDIYSVIDPKSHLINGNIWTEGLYLRGEGVSSASKIISNSKINGIGEIQGQAINLEFNGNEYLFNNKENSLIIPGIDNLGVINDSSMSGNSYVYGSVIGSKIINAKSNLSTRSFVALDASVINSEVSNGCYFQVFEHLYSQNICDQTYLTSGGVTDFYDFPVGYNILKQGSSVYTIEGHRILKSF